MSQLAVLIALERAPGLSNAELARASFMTPPSMVELLSSLEDAGLILRRPHPAGGRILQAQLTPEGLKVMREAQARLKVVEERLLFSLAVDERDRLRELLGRCIAALQAPAAT
jgi:DNA-binding MarR family transcriptional regulator